MFEASMAAAPSPQPVPAAEGERLINLRHIAGAEQLRPENRPVIKSEAVEAHGMSFHATCASNSSKRRAWLGPVSPSSAALRDAILYVDTDGEVCRIDPHTVISPAKRPCGPVVAMCRDTGEWEVITETGRIPVAKALGRFEQLQREVEAAAKATMRHSGVLSRPSSSSSLSSLASHSESGLSDEASVLGAELLSAHDQPEMSEIDEMLALSLDPHTMHGPAAKELLTPRLDDGGLDVKFEPGEFDDVLGEDDVLSTFLDGMCGEGGPKSPAGSRPPSTPSSPTSSSESG
jgi:hypothetical protein